MRKHETTTPARQASEATAGRSSGAGRGAGLAPPPYGIAFADSAATVQRQPVVAENRTGMPDALKAGIERLSGIDMSDVRVHANSSKPARLDALAYAHGNDIHLGPGQEKHLPHEAWHVVQQKQGRVKPTMQMKDGVPVNNDQGLEHEADVMGPQALTSGTAQLVPNGPGAEGGLAQRMADCARHAKQRLNFLPTQKSAIDPVQRIVDLNGVGSDPALLWPQVTNLVQSRFKRKQTLYRWATDKVSRTFQTPRDLANALDQANSKQGVLGRGRPDFSPKLIAIFNNTHGGTWHRRHIIMSSHMRDAVYATTERNYAHPSTLSTYNDLVAEVRIPAALTLAQAEANLVYVLHNNPANLVIDRGDWNSAIGAFAHNVSEKLKQDQTAAFTDYQRTKVLPGKDNFFSGLVAGFQPQIQQQIVAFWQSYEEPSDVSEFTEMLEIMYDNAAVDLMSSRPMPLQHNLTQMLLETHALFASAQTHCDLNTLKQACSKYISTGTNIGAVFNNKPIYYKDVL